MHLMPFSWSPLSKYRKRFRENCWRASSLCCHVPKRRFDSLSHRLGVSYGPEMHEEQARLLGKHVAMQRCHLDVVFLKRGDDRVDLFGPQGKIPCRRDSARTSLLKIDGLSHALS